MPIIIYVLVVIGAFLVAVTVHEFAHALVADKLGDPTARLQGRLTLNPIPHLDKFGSVLVPMLLILSRAPIVFGWAKPVPFDPFNLENPRRDAALISIAGPISNLITAIAFALLFRLGTTLITGFNTGLIAAALHLVVQLNIVLAIFNFIPVHPLDGGKILIGLLPRDLAYEWDAILNRYGILILIFLIFPFFGTAPVTQLIVPIINGILSILLP